MVLLAFYSLSAFCQNGGVGVNPNGAPPDPSAALDINYINKGLLFPRLTTAQRDAIANPANGLHIYNTDCGVDNYFNGSFWVPIGVGGVAALQQPSISLPNGYACPFSVANFSIAPIPDATNYIWQVPDGDTITSGQGTASVGVNMGSSYTNNWISVQAITACATVSSYTNFNLQPLPSATVVYPPGSNIYSSQFYANWNWSANATSFQVDLATDTGFTNIIQSQNVGGTTAAWIGIPNFCTTYYYRVEAVSNCGLSTPSNYIEIPAGGPTPVANAAQNIGPGQFDANWQWFPDNNLSVQNYYIDVATDNNFTNPAPGSPFYVNAGNFVATVSGLTCNTNYYYRVSYVGPCGTSAYSDTVAFTTSSGSPGQPSAPITSSTNVCINQSGVVFSVSPIGGANTYSWSGLPSGSIITNGDGTSNITVTIGGTPGIYNVSVAGSYGATCPFGPASPSVADTVNSGTPATPGAVSGTGTVCAYATGELYSISSVDGANSYNWTYPSDASIVLGQGSTSANISYGVQNGNICVSSVNGCGASAPSCISVNMLSPSGGAPTITGQPANETLCLPGNTSATFSVVATGSGLTYQWQVSTDNGNTFINLTNGGVYSNINTATLNITGATAGLNRNQYRCAVGPCPISTSNEAILLSQAAGSQTFAYTGSQQTFTVPPCAATITIECWGAQGGNTSGGLGGYSIGNLAVTPGDILYVYVGQAGSGPGSGETFGGGGSAGFDYRGSGGGASDVRLGGADISNRIIVAGGGGGSSSDPCCSANAHGGAGGGLIGGNGSDNNSFGGTQDSYGTGSCCPCDAPVQGHGEDGYCSGCNGAGGGGGYYGGGACTQGGGGSGYIGGVTSGSMQSGVQTGNGQVIITW